MIIRPYIGPTFAGFYLSTKENRTILIHKSILHIIFVDGILILMGNLKET